MKSARCANGYGTKRRIARCSREGARYAREERNRWPRTQRTILPSETEEEKKNEKDKEREEENRR